MVKVMPTYETRRDLINKRIHVLRNDMARYIKHGWTEAAEDARLQIITTKLEKKALVRL